jgi:hypothetical protein
MSENICGGPKTKPGANVKILELFIGKKCQTVDGFFAPNTASSAKRDLVLKKNRRKSPKSVIITLTQDNKIIYNNNISLIIYYITYIITYV